MTLILSEITSRWALQVSDRLTTQVAATGARPYDARANKTVILEAANSIAALSFTGLAYLERAPTDSWIAAKLNGEQYPFDPTTHEIAARTAIRRTTWPQVGQALAGLAKALTDLRATHQPLREMPVAVAAAGWLWYRRSRWPRSFLAFIAPSNDGVYRVHWSPRQHGAFFLQMTLPPGYLSQAEQNELGQRLSALELPDAENELLATVRRVAARTETVGADCMTIRIAHPFEAERTVSARFARNDDPAQNPARNPETPAHVAYSPWVVGRHHLLAPMLLTGVATTWQLGPYSLRLEGPPTPAPLPYGIAGFGPQERRRWP